MIYLIGGAARCGKSTITKELRETVRGQVVSGDVMTHALRAILEPEWLPDIFDRSIVPPSHFTDNDLKVDRLRRRDEAMWRFYEALCDTALQDSAHDDVLIEGNIWPDFLENFQHPHKAVFMVDSSEDQYERLIAIRDSTNSDNNWMQDYDDERMKQWARFNAERSRRYIELCQRYGYPYFDVDDHGIEIAEMKALAYLRSPAV